jgi:hypothetical protein
VRACDRPTRAASGRKVRIKDLVRQLMPMTPFVGDLGNAYLGVLEKPQQPSMRMGLVSAAGEGCLVGVSAASRSPALAALRASPSSATVKIVTDSPIRIAPRIRPTVSESPSQRTALASPKTGMRLTMMLAGAARTRAMA